MLSRVFLITLVAFAFVGFACVPAGSDASLNNLPDADGDGFGELDVPDGVDTTGEIEVQLTNSITRAEVEAMFGDQLPPGSELATITISETITRTFEGGQQITDMGSQLLGPFELAFETPCPEQVNVVVGVSASVPLIGEVFSQEVTSLTGALDGGVGDFTYECNNSISVEAFLDENGQPDANFCVEPL